MTDIKNECNNILIHIKKCRTAMEFDGYTDAGIVGYFIKIPFKKIHRKRFLKIETYIKDIKIYIKENDIDFEIELFEELQNSSIIYNSSQVYTLGYSQYEHRIKYLEYLEKKIKLLIELT